MDLLGNPEDAVEALATPHVGIADHDSGHSDGDHHHHHHNEEEEDHEFTLTENHHHALEEGEGLEGFEEEEEAVEDEEEMSAVGEDFRDQHGSFDHPASTFERSRSERVLKSRHSSSGVDSSGSDSGINGVRSVKKEVPAKLMPAQVGKSCNCKNTKCLKLYCECFAAGEYCKEYRSSPLLLPFGASFLSP